MVEQLLKLLAPFFLTTIVQIIKKIFRKGGAFALFTVFMLGGLGALSGAGVVPDESWIDQTINTGYLVGVSSFLYSLLKRLK